MSNRTRGFADHRGNGARRSGDSCCSCRQNTQRVAPENGLIPGSDMVQVAENRIIRVRHVNPRPRDPQFESQMQAFMRNEYGEAKSPSVSQKHHPGSGEENLTSAAVNDSPSNRQYTPRNRTKSAGPTRARQSFQTSSPQTSPVKSQTRTVTNSAIRREGTRTSSSVIVDLDHHESPEHLPNLPPTLEDDVEEIPLTPRSKVQSSTKVVGPEVLNCVIFMFHGVGGSSDIWQSQIKYFEREGYEVVCPDFVGHGFSSAPRDKKAYLFKRLAKDMLFIFDKYCKRRNVLVGHSYGSSFACHLARERSSFTSQLVTISGGSPTPLAPQPGIFQWPVCCLQGCKPMLKSAFRKSAFHIDEPVVPRDKAFDVPTYVLKHTMNGQDWAEGTFDYHSLIAMPTLIIHGEHDGLISIEEEEEMAQAIKGSEMIVINDASHMVMIEQPDIVNTLIHDMITAAKQQLR